MNQRQLWSKQTRGEFLDFAISFPLIFQELIKSHSFQRQKDLDIKVYEQTSQWTVLVELNLQYEHVIFPLRFSPMWFEC